MSGSQLCVVRLTTRVTHVTRKTTSFAPIPLPRLPTPTAIPHPDHLSTEVYPLAQAPCPEDLRIFGVNLGGRRVLVKDDNTIVQGDLPAAESGPGWTRALPGEPGYVGNMEVLTLAEALNDSKRSKDPRKRPHVATPPIATSNAAAGDHASPPRKRVRGLEAGPQDNNPPPSPLPSPDNLSVPLPSTSGSSSDATPYQAGAADGMEIATLLSLSALVEKWEKLPDKVQSQVALHMLRRSRMPTIQRICAFAGKALKRDFIAHLPHELTLQLLRAFDRPTLAVATRVCKRWHRIIESERTIWLQRLMDDGMYYGHGVEREDELHMRARMEALERVTEMKKRSQNTTMDLTRFPAVAPVVCPSTPLKHVYRRRFLSKENWLSGKSQHMAFPGQGTNVITSLQFDSDKIVTASDDHSVSVYNMATGQLRRRFDGHEGGVWALEYRGDILVTGSTDRTVRIWNLDTLSEMHVFHGHLSTVRCLQIIEPVLDEATGEYQPAYPMFVTGSRDSTLRVWKLPKKNEPPVEVQYDEDGEEIPMMPENNPWHVSCLRGHSQAVRALSAHGRTCISASYDMTLRVWDIVTGQCKHILRGHEDKVYSVAYDRFRNQCASGSLDHTVKVWDVATGECLHTLTGHTSLIGLLGMSPNHIVSAAADSSLRVWDANTNKLKHALASHSGAISCFQHDEVKVVSGSDGLLKLWDLQTGRQIKDLVIGITSIWQAAFKDDRLVVVASRNGTTYFEVYDFSFPQHPSGVDNVLLDNIIPPAWESPNPREPRAYQFDEDMTDDEDATGGQRRSVGGKSLPTGAPPVSFVLAAGPSGRHLAHLPVEYSPSPAGPSSLAGPSNSNASAWGLASREINESFPPMFDASDGEFSLVNSLLDDADAFE